MTLSEAKDVLLATLLPLYERREAAQITHMVLEHLTGLTSTDRPPQINKQLSDEQLAQFQDYTLSLAAGKPVQYVLGEAWFAGLRFMVNEHTLIPRPETEELIEWIREVAGSVPLSILDIGTGSGCIPVTLKKCFRTGIFRPLTLAKKLLQLRVKTPDYRVLRLILYKWIF